jgi:protein AATF/BFR2
LGLELDDPKYQGRKVRRSDILNEESEQDDFDPFQGASDESDGSQEESEDIDEDEEQDFEMSDEGSYSSGDQEDGSNEEDDNDDKDNNFEDQEYSEDVNDELERLQKEEETLVKNLSKSSLNDVEKGKAVQAQKVSYPSLIFR